MGALEDSTVYLSGAVEFDSSSSWRGDLTKRLESIGLKVFNPLIKPSWFPNITGEMQNQWKECLGKKDKKFFERVNCDFYLAANDQVRDYCLYLVSQANFVILYLNDNIRTFGSFEELSLCKMKPVFIVSDISDIPSMWLVSQLGLGQENWGRYFHRSFDSLVNTLGEINSNGSSSFGLKERLKWFWLSYWGADHV